MYDCQTNVGYPDFKHKQSQQALWVDGKWNPRWVASKLAEMAPGTIKIGLFSWNTILTKCVNAGQDEKTLELFYQMQAEGPEPDAFTFISVLHACARLGEVEIGKRIHSHIIRSGFEADTYVGTSLISMYSKCGSIDSAQHVFDMMPTHDLVSWNAMIAGCVKCGDEPKALELFHQMQEEGVTPDPATFIGVLNSCAKLGALEEGRRVHGKIIEHGWVSDTFVGSALVDMFAKCGSIEDSWKVFRMMHTQDLVLWNAMILGLVKCGQSLEALSLFSQMEMEHVKPDSVTFVGALNACASLGSLEEGRCIHAKIIKSGCDSNAFIGNSLIDMYAKCCSLEDASRVFYRMPNCDVFAWTALIGSNVAAGKGKEALLLFEQMCMEGVKPDAVSFVGILNACASIGALEEGKQIQECIVACGCESDAFVRSSLIDMYTKCGHVEDARSIFNRMPRLDLATWNAMIRGYIKCGQGEESLKLFQQMQAKQVRPDHSTFVEVLNACASVMALEEGKRVHAQIIQSNLEANIVVGNSLIDMYAKCGCMENAWMVFNEMPLRDVVSWNSMLGGCAIHGQGSEAIQLFESLQHEGLGVDKVTFVCLLSACSHAGLVDEGLHFFEAMNTVYGVPQTVEHYGCMVDLLGRAGCLDQAENMLKNMSDQDFGSPWKALLSACMVHGNVKMEKHIAKRILELDPGNS